MIDDLVGQRVYIDANALIYFAEAHPTLGPPMRAVFELHGCGDN